MKRRKHLLLFLLKIYSTLLEHLFTTLEVAGQKFDFSKNYAFSLSQQMNIKRRSSTAMFLIYCNKKQYHTKKISSITCSQKKTLISSTKNAFTYLRRVRLNMFFQKTSHSKKKIFAVFLFYPLYIMSENSIIDVQFGKVE